MPDIHCGKQTKLPKTIGVPIRHNGRNNQFTVPSRGRFFVMDDKQNNPRCDAAQRSIPSWANLFCL